MRERLFALAPLVLLASCGYVGDPLPPALNIPNPVTDLAAIQHGDKIVLTYTVPPQTTEGLPLRHLGPPRIQVGDKQLEGTAHAPGKATEEITIENLVGKRVPVRVQINNGRGRYSQWSNEVVLNVVEPLKPPVQPVAASDVKGVRVTWQGETRPGETWRVFRTGTDTAAVVDKPEYIDTTAEVGKEYTYRIQSVLGTAESDLSVPASVLARDVAPPSVPSGLNLVQGIDTVELGWDPNTEPDFKAYRVYRSVGNGAMQLLADNVQAPAYSDKQIKSNETYRYAVTALDQAGNESGKSQVVEVHVR